MGCKVLWLNVALLSFLMICEHVRAQCTQPSFPSRNVIMSESSILATNFPDGSTVTFECDTGYKPVNSRASKYVTCERDQWTSLELECTKKSCGSPPEFDHGKYEIEGVLFGDKITAVCNTGYMLDAQIKYRWCREGGWDGRDPVCEAVKCKAPPAIVNGQLGEAPLDSYDYSQVVSYKCNSGFSLIGSSSLHCSDDGTFKPDPPKCLDGCPKPEIPHASRTGGKPPPYKLSNFIDYKCDDGYTMKGESHIVCTENGWNPEPPKCIGPCSRPDFGRNVTLTQEFQGQKSFPYGSKATFECVQGLKPVDSTVSSSVTCEENNWTKLLLTCKVVKCKAPPTIVNGQLGEAPLDSYNYSQTVSYKCNSGFSLTGSSTLHCSKDGTFKPDPPKCLVLSTTSTSTTTTTSTIVTSKTRPNDDRSDTASSSNVLRDVMIACAVIAFVVGCGLCVYFHKRKQSKHEEVAREDEKL